MKPSPQEQKLEEVLRSSKLVAGGFMGQDRRSPSEIVEEDQAALAHLRYTARQLAARMDAITRTAIAGLGTWVAIDSLRQARVDEAKGSLPCPWPHSGRFAKRVTTLQRLDTGQTIQWSDLNIHMIAEHAFFEGKGSPFRIEPDEIVLMIF